MTSIIIPVYNVEADLRECLDSVLAQTEPDWECIVVDDGSTDSSADIAAEFAAADSRFRLVSQPNAGQSVARNAGLDRARGEWVAFLDGDDTLHPEFLKTLLKAAKAEAADIVAAGFTRSSGFHALPDQPRFRTLTPSAAIEKALYRRRAIDTSAWGKIYRRELFDNDMRFTPGIIFEDLEIFPRLWERAGLISITGLPLYFYRQREGSSLMAFTPRLFVVLDVTDAIERRYADRPHLRRAARDRRLSASFNLLMLLLKNGMGNSAEARRCFGTIRQLRLPALLNPRTRMRNRLGALASFGGPKFLDALNRRLKLV